VEYKAQYQYLKTLLTQHKQQLFAQKVANRTQYYCLVLDQLEAPHNVNAILRSADVFGFQSVFGIEAETLPEVKRGISKGADKWVTFTPFIGPQAHQVCFDTLESNGYILTGLSGSPQAIDVWDLDPTKKRAFVLGNEKYGLRPASLSRITEMVRIPMVGFSESLNVSVVAGILMAILRKKLPAHLAQLPDETTFQVLCEWALKTIPSGPAILSHFLTKTDR
jgi:tRNA (guanosine-2'-O-)-methyltransferase